MPGLSIRANGSSLPLVLIKRIAHVRGGGRVTLSVTATAVPAPPKGEPSLASPSGGGGLALARTERASAGSQPSSWGAAFSVRHRPGKAWPVATVSLASFQADAH